MQLQLGHTKLIPYSTEHQVNEVGSVGRKEAKINLKAHCPCSNNGFGTSNKWLPSISGPLARVIHTNLLLYNRNHNPINITVAL